MPTTKISKRDLVIDILEFRAPAYVPWTVGVAHDDAHLWMCPVPGGKHDYGVKYVVPEGHGLGVPVDCPLKRLEDLETYQFPQVYTESCFAQYEAWRQGMGDVFSLLMLGGTLFELAWSLRSMEDLLCDMVESPEFVEELLGKITDHRLEQVQQALCYTNCDAIWFGDDYGMQTSLMMGEDHWRHYIKPHLQRLFAPVRDAGRYVYLHSCGKVECILDDLVEIGLNIFNPFQPEVMDVFSLLPQYHGRLAFHGGMGVQSILPHGTPDEVRAMTTRLIDAGRPGGYIIAPSHAMGRDVPGPNIDAMLEVLRGQAGFR